MDIMENKSEAEDNLSRGTSRLEASQNPEDLGSSVEAGDEVDELEEGNEQAMAASNCEPDLILLYDKEISSLNTEVLKNELKNFGKKRKQRYWGVFVTSQVFRERQILRMAPQKSSWDNCFEAPTPKHLVPGSQTKEDNIRAVYTRENKPRLTLAEAYIIRERNHLYEYKLP